MVLSCGLKDILQCPRRRIPHWHARSVIAKVQLKCPIRFYKVPKRGLDSVAAGGLCDREALYNHSNQVLLLLVTCDQTKAWTIVDRMSTSDLLCWGCQYKTSQIHSKQVLWHNYFYWTFMEIECLKGEVFVSRPKWQILGNVFTLKEFLSPQFLFNYLLF